MGRGFLFCRGDMQLLSTELQTALNDQLTLERFANASYIAFSAKCEADSFPGFARWHARAAGDETSHSGLVRDFLIDRNAVPKYDALDAVTLPADYLASFVEAQALEARVTEALTQLYYIAEVAEDVQACRLASDMLIEQRKSERELVDIVRRLQFSQGNAAAVLKLDHELGGA